MMPDLLGFFFFGFVFTMLVALPMSLWIMKKIINKPTPEERRSKFKVIKEKKDA